MAMYTVRVQTVLSREQFDLLTRLSEETQKPLSMLVREAIQQVYVEKNKRQRRRQALQKLLELEAPVADWAQMEKEIINGSIE
jgi:predicted DNA-binding protein